MVFDLDQPCETLNLAGLIGDDFDSGRWFALPFPVTAPLVDCEAIKDPGSYASQIAVSFSVKVIDG